MLVDAAHSAKVKLLVWSGLESCIQLSDGKYKNIQYFDSKAEVTKYAQEIRVPFANVQAGMYMANFTGVFAPKKLADGSFIMTGPGAPESVLPVLDTSNDYGLFVRAAIEHPEGGSEVLAHGEVISLANMAKQLAEITGKNIRYVQVTDELYIAEAKALGFPEETARTFLEMYAFCAEFGYFGPKDVEPSRKYLSRVPHTWADYAKAFDWSKITN